jgi:hypothetical protein
MTRNLVVLVCSLMIHAGARLRNTRQPIIRQPLKLKSTTRRFASFADITRLTRKSPSIPSKTVWLYT